MIYCFDIDGTICETEGEDYANAKPIRGMVERIKALHGEGHEIRYYTARGMSGGKRSSEWQRIMARKQLREWGLPDAMVYSKPYADVYVDDRAVNVRDWAT